MAEQYSSNSPDLDEEKVLRPALSQLVSIGFRKKTPINIPLSGTPLQQACEIIAQVMGFTFLPFHPGQKTVEEICNAAKIRFRKIPLEGKWWHQNLGHLVVFETNTSQPIALIYDKKKHYISINPSDGSEIPVTGKNSQRYVPTAYSFFAPLPAKATSLKQLFFFCLRGTHQEYTFIAFVSVLLILLNFFVPFATKVLFDYVIPDVNLTLYYQVMIGLAVTVISTSIFFYSRSRLMLYLEGLMENRLELALWDRLLRLPVQFFRKIPSGDLIQRTLIVDTLRRLLSDAVLQVILNGFFSIFYLALMFLYSWELSLVGIAIVIIDVILSSIALIAKLFYERKLLVSNAKINTFLTQVVNGIAKLRVAAAESRIFALWAQEFTQNQHLESRAQNLENIVITQNAVLSLFSSLAIFAVVIFMMTSGNDVLGEPWISVGSYLAFTAAFSPFAQAIFDLFHTLIDSVMVIPFWERARVIVTTPTETSEQKLHDITFTGEINIQNLYFRYHPDTPYVIRDLSFQINPGEFIGIVGPSGCGKSTLCRLLIGFETPEKGAIYYDKKDLTSIDVERLRKQIGIVLQNSAIFFGTIYDNITCGNTYTTSDLLYALEVSTFNRDLENLPMGLDTILPSGGSTLSGGQRQRLLLARALIKKPKILILDEATSSLDNQTQDTISHNLAQLNVTRIVVAHRLSTVRDANRLLKF